MLIIPLYKSPKIDVHLSKQLQKYTEKMIFMQNKDSIQKNASIKKFGSRPKEIVSQLNPMLLFKGRNSIKLENEELDNIELFEKEMLLESQELANMFAFDNLQKDNEYLSEDKLNDLRKQAYNKQNEYDKANKIYQNALIDIKKKEKDYEDAKRDYEQLIQLRDQQKSIKSFLDEYYARLGGANEGHLAKSSSIVKNLSELQRISDVMKRIQRNRFKITDDDFVIFKSNSDTAAQPIDNGSGKSRVFNALDLLKVKMVEFNVRDDIIDNQIKNKVDDLKKQYKDSVSQIENYKKDLNNIDVQYKELHNKYKDISHDKSDRKDSFDKFASNVDKGLHATDRVLSTTLSTSGKVLGTVANTTGKAYRAVSGVTRFGYSKEELNEIDEPTTLTLSGAFGNITIQVKCIIIDSNINELQNIFKRDLRKVIFSNIESYLSSKIRKFKSIWNRRFIDADFASTEYFQNPGMAQIQFDITDLGYDFDVTRINFRDLQKLQKLGWKYVYIINSAKKQVWSMITYESGKTYSNVIDMENLLRMYDYRTKTGQKFEEIEKDIKMVL